MADKGDRASSAGYSGAGGQNSPGEGAGHFGGSGLGSSSSGGGSKGGGSAPGSGSASHNTSNQGGGSSGRSVGRGGGSASAHPGGLSGVSSSHTYSGSGAPGRASEKSGGAPGRGDDMDHGGSMAAGRAADRASVPGYSGDRRGSFTGMMNADIGRAVQQASLRPNRDWTTYPGPYSNEMEEEQQRLQRQERQQPLPKEALPPGMNWPRQLGPISQSPGVLGPVGPLVQSGLAPPDIPGGITGMMGEEIGPPIPTQRMPVGPPISNIPIPTPRPDLQNPFGTSPGLLGPPQEPVQRFQFTPPPPPNTIPPAMQEYLDKLRRQYDPRLRERVAPAYPR